MDYQPFVASRTVPPGHYLSLAQTYVARSQEYQADLDFWDPQPYSSNAILPAPVPQRYVSVPMTPDKNGFSTLLSLLVVTMRSRIYH
jgi:hypothetical protein